MLIPRFVQCVTGLFRLLLARSACYWLVPGSFRLLLTCSLLVPLVTGLFHLFRVLETSLVGHRKKELLCIILESTDLDKGVFMYFDAGGFSSAIDQLIPRSKTPC